MTHNVLAKLDGVAVTLPAEGVWPEQQVNVNFRQVSSSNIDQVGWDRFRTMYVRFKSGALYLYPGVSRQRAVACAYAASVGQYLNKKVKKKFECIRIA
jgi:hypothetical protein